MHQLDQALDREIQEMDTVLLRLTTLRLLMAAGKHRLVDRAVAELDEAMGSFEAVEQEVMSKLGEQGFSTLDEAAASQPEHDSELQTRMSTLRGLHREVRVALATTGAAAERSVRITAEHLEGLSPIVQPKSRHPFLTAE